MLPVSCAEQLNTSGAMVEPPMISQSCAYSRLVRPAPRSLSGRNRFQRPRSRALALSSSMIGGICHRVGPELSWSEKTCSLGATCLFMKSVSCSMYILVFFEYSNSMWALPAPAPLVRCASAPDVAPTLGPSRAIVNAGGGPASGLGEPSVVEKCETYATSGADHALDLRHGYRDGELGIPRARGGARADQRGPHDAVDRHLRHDRRLAGRARQRGAGRDGRHRLPAPGQGGGGGGAAGPGGVRRPVLARGRGARLRREAGDRRARAHAVLPSRLRQGGRARQADAGAADRGAVRAGGRSPAR